MPSEPGDGDVIAPNLPPNLAPDRTDAVRILLSKKQLELTKIIVTLRSGPIVDAATDELRLCTAWAVALNDGGGRLPPVADDQPLLDAIARVASALQNTANVNAIAQATANLIAAYKG